MNTEFDFVKESFGEEGNLIISYEIIGKSNDLRFVSRMDYDLHKNIRILQQNVCVKVFFSETVHRSFGGNVITDEKTVWIDVPFGI